MEELWKEQEIVILADVICQEMCMSMNVLCSFGPQDIE